MPEEKKTLTILGQSVAVIQKEIESSKECFNEYTLSDGTVLKVKWVVTGISQIDGQKLPDGNPMFLIFGTPVTSVVSLPAQR